MFWGEGEGQLKKKANNYIRKKGNRTYKAKVSIVHTIFLWCCLLTFLRMYLRFKYMIRASLGKYIYKDIEGAVR